MSIIRSRPGILNPLRPMISDTGRQGSHGRTDVLGRARSDAQRQLPSLFSGRQLFTGIVLRVDNHYLIGNKNAPDSSSVANLLGTENNELIKVRVNIPALDVAKRFPENQNDQSAIDEFMQFTCHNSVLGGRQPIPGDQVIVSVFDTKSQTKIDAGVLLQFHSGTAGGFVDIYGLCTDDNKGNIKPRSAPAEKSKIPNHTAKVSSENPDRVGAAKEIPRQQQPPPPQDPPAPPAPIPSTADPNKPVANPECRKIYMMKSLGDAEADSGVNGNSQAYVDESPLVAGTKPAWRYGKHFADIEVEKWRGQLIEKNMLIKLKEMDKAFQTAMADGTKLKINSGYRGPEKQKSLRMRYMNKDRKRELAMQGWTMDQSTVNGWIGRKYTSLDDFLQNAWGNEDGNFTRPVSSPGGGNSHTAGTAVDIQTGMPNIRKKQAPNRVYRWLVENSWKYGFVRNTRKERWHFHWIGARSAGAATAKGISKNHWSWDGIRV